MSDSGLKIAGCGQLLENVANSEEIHLDFTLIDTVNLRLNFVFSVFYLIAIAQISEYSEMRCYFHLSLAPNWVTTNLNIKQKILLEFLL